MTMSTPNVKHSNRIRVHHATLHSNSVAASLADIMPSRSHACDGYHASLGFTDSELICLPLIAHHICIKYTKLEKHSLEHIPRPKMYKNWSMSKMAYVEKKEKKLILYPGLDANQSENLIDSFLRYIPSTHKISRKSGHNFLSNLVVKQTSKLTDSQTNRQTNKSQNITSVKM